VKLRVIAVPIAGLALVLAGFLTYGNLNQNLVYYLTVDEALEQRADFDDGRRFRLAGEVAHGTVETAGETVTFTISDGHRGIPVRHDGDPPQLFREGIEVVLEGAWEGDHFASDLVIIMHDADYRAPPIDGGGER
jgi:cytochrome c-type biogenesis protein CcmE